VFFELAFFEHLKKNLKSSSFLKVMAFEFPTNLHAIAFKHYDHIARSREDASFILWKINENNLADYVKTFLNSSQFDIDANIRSLWNQTKDEEDPELTGIQEDMLIFLLNMYCCEVNKKKRSIKIKRGFV
jgi:hypothetical protein